VAAGRAAARHQVVAPELVVRQSTSR
ncbi:MAG: hypothetical protein QOI35_719, partial [Cryptosporangiaceae bacterium]|nr:hypothetical protein [Cryptosporangiaceae bacterium]